MQNKGYRGLMQTAVKCAWKLICWYVTENFVEPLEVEYEDRWIWQSWLCLIDAICIKNASEHSGWAKWVLLSLLVKNIPSFEGNIICLVNTPISEMDSVPLLRWGTGQKGQCIQRHKKSSNHVSCLTYFSILCIAVSWYTKTAAIFQSIWRYTIATVMWVSFRYHQWLLLTCVISLPCFTLQYVSHISFQMSSFVLCDDILKQFWLCTYRNCNVSEAPYWLILLCPCEPWYSLSEGFFLDQYLNIH
jgi:hypothetical protein